MPVVMESVRVQEDHEPIHVVSDRAKEPTFKSEPPIKKKQTLIMQFQLDEELNNKNRSIDMVQDTSAGMNNYLVVVPQSPPRLKLASSPTHTKLQSTFTKKDSFFGGKNTASLDGEYLVDYIISNDDGEMSSLINSNPQFRSLILANRRS